MPSQAKVVLTWHYFIFVLRPAARQEPANRNSHILPQDIEKHLQSVGANGTEPHLYRLKWRARLNATHPSKAVRIAGWCFRCKDVQSDRPRHVGRAMSVIGLNAPRPQVAVDRQHQKWGSRQQSILFSSHLAPVLIRASRGRSQPCRTSSLFASIAGEWWCLRFALLFRRCLFRDVGNCHVDVVARRSGGAFAGA